jgi:hypothetical protein
MTPLCHACLGYFVYLFQNQEVNDHTGNLITICLMHERRRKGSGSVIIGALLERMSRVACTARKLDVSCHAIPARPGAAER